MKDSEMGFGPIARLAMVVSMALSLQSCALAAYGLGVATMVNDSTTRQTEVYESYVQRTEAENERRAKAGKPGQPVLSLRDWSRQNAPR